MNAYRFGELSNIYPIARGLSPLILSIVTLIIGQDVLSGGQFAGIIIISLSMITLGFMQFRLHQDGQKRAYSCLFYRHVYCQLLDGGCVRITANRRRVAIL